MTEHEIRDQVVATITAWVGGKRNGAEHAEILALYNGHRPLPRGYAVQSSDAYCAATVSAAWLKAGIADHVPIECSCNNMIALAQALGCWNERDDYPASLGDAIVYDWDDDGNGDCVGSAEHIGLIVDKNGDGYTVIEGNMSGGRIGTRRVPYNSRHIRGYITPDYTQIAIKITEKEQKEMNETAKPETPTVPDWAEKELREAMAYGITDGTRPNEPATRYEVACMAVRAMHRAVELAARKG